MLTAEQNARLTQVGAGTPCGMLMRRYWHPIWMTAKLPAHGSKQVRLLGEDLVLYRDRSGQLGLVAQRCPHRGAAMVFAVPEEQGIRCAYHGWLYDETGRCLEQPYEKLLDPDSDFKDKIRIKAYPVEELGGLIFAYLGPQPAPLLPRWDVLVQENVVREIGWVIMPCNWYQIMENDGDSAHVPSLHHHFNNYALEQLGRPDLQRPARPLTATNAVSEKTWFGRQRLRTVDGKQVPYTATIFPYMIRLPGGTLQMPVPVDDTHVFNIYYFAYDPVALKTELEIDWEPQTDPRDIPIFEVPLAGSPGGVPDWPLLDNAGGQDAAILSSQGEIADRTNEHLGLSDRGVIWYRQLVEEQIQIVEEGGDPVGTFRDPTTNEYLEVPTGERGAVGWRFRNANGVVQHNLVRKYSPMFRAAVAKIHGEAALDEPVRPT